MSYKRDNNHGALEFAAKRGKSISIHGDLDEYSEEEFEFLKAMDAYKTKFKRVNPTCCEVLAVLKSIGWEKKSG